MDTAYPRVMPFFFICSTFSGVYPCACIHWRANRTGEYQKAPSTNVTSAATRMATMLTVAVGIGSPLRSELTYNGSALPPAEVQPLRQDQAYSRLPPIRTPPPTTLPVCSRPS